ncbi:MAG TPA: hypothetical protein VIJ12_06115 [Candidatus Baltobacteraceae bacterium]
MRTRFFAVSGLLLAVALGADLGLRDPCSVTIGVLGAPVAILIIAILGYFAAQTVGYFPLPSWTRRAYLIALVVLPS